MATQIIVVALAIGTAFFIYKMFPDTTKSLVRALDITRTTVFFVGTVLFALVFIGSGNSLLIFIGFILLVYISIKGLTDYDREDIKQAYDTIKQ